MTTQARPDESLRPALEALSACDPDIARHYRACGLPPVRRRPEGFAGLIHIIAAQQVSAASANAIIGRIEAATSPLAPETFLALDETALKATGLSRPKARYGRALAEDLLAGCIDLDGLDRLDDAVAGRGMREPLIPVQGANEENRRVTLIFPEAQAGQLTSLCAAATR